MQANSKIIGKREFIQHTSKYLKWVDENEEELIITHHNQPNLIITKIKSKKLKDLRGFAQIKTHGDFNEPEFMEFDKWS